MDVERVSLSLSLSHLGAVAVMEGRCGASGLEVVMGGAGGLRMRRHQRVLHGGWIRRHRRRVAVLGHCVASAVVLEKFIQFHFNCLVE